MITKRQMTSDDFVLIMQANKDIYPCSDEQLREAAELNIATGVAETYIEDGEILGVGGIRYVGVGEGWFISIPERRRLKLLEFIANQFTRIRKAKKLTTIFATSKISERFLFHLGFTKQGYVYSERGPK